MTVPWGSSPPPLAESLAMRAARSGIGMIGADERLERLDLRLLRLDLPLLRLDLLLQFAHPVDQHDVEAVVFHPFDLALGVVGDEQRVHRGDILRAEADV